MSTIPDPLTPLVCILNGPNLNLLGAREPEIYGARTLADIETDCTAHAAKLGLRTDFRQSNHEGALVDWLHEAGATAVAAIINAGAYSHTSIALHDAIKSIPIPVIEMHLSNIHAREAFREQSLTARAATAVICGFGADGYLLALDAAKRLTQKVRNQ
ncbi:MAG: type II 3-dehydroquinate dehydratase [Alphaproteobacteria bacterium]|nr:type II 3-dehydroquinate dehydratase [Alphaproteobacteria bacterium]